MFESLPNFIRVTWPRPRPFSEFLFLRFGEIVHVHRYAKFQVCSFTRFEDIFEGVPNFIRVTWPRPRPFSEILFVHFIEIVYVHPCAKFQVSSFTGLGDMFEDMPKFIRVTWPRPRPFPNFYLSILEKLSTCTSVPNLKSLALLVLEICLRVCQIL